MIGVVPLRPATDIPAMLRKLADEVEAEAVANVFVVIEPIDADELGIACYGVCNDPFRAAGAFTKAARDILP